VADHQDLEAREAKHGQKMISVNVRFWTDELTEQGKILPKHAWVHGVVHLETNPSAVYPLANGKAGGKLPAGNTTSRTPARSFSAAAR
jgi:hypothetical protein